MQSTFSDSYHAVLSYRRNVAAVSFGCVEKAANTVALPGGTSFVVAVLAHRAGTTTPKEFF
ncbi:hypothetical protein LC1Hm_4171 (plasmid) [Halomicrobium sp. LC1Hm]|nr:hypothetical protein LC1Hm_4171 [Halomicrobium sp. LC1Hm]